VSDSSNICILTLTQFLAIKIDFHSEIISDFKTPTILYPFFLHFNIQSLLNEKKHPFQYHLIHQNK
jgi:hypothetical protein